jgi:hypothetical protein
VTSVSGAIGPDTPPATEAEEMKVTPWWSAGVGKTFAVEVSPADSVVVQLMSAFQRSRAAMQNNH